MDTDVGAEGPPAIEEGAMEYDGAAMGPPESPPLAPPAQWRVLVACSAGSGAGPQGPAEGGVEELKGCPHAVVRLLSDADAAAIQKACAEFQPNLLYVRGSVAKDARGTPVVGPYRAPGGGGMDVDGGTAVGVGALAAALGGAAEGLQVAFFDVADADVFDGLQKLQEAGTDVGICWLESDAVPAGLFSRAFFAALRTPGMSATEAYAMGVAAIYANCRRLQGAFQVAPQVPVFIHSAPPQFPGPVSVKETPVNGVHPRLVDPGFDTLRLITPRSDARLLVSGAYPSAVDAEPLRVLGEALRGVLVSEVRGATVLLAQPPHHPVAGIPPSVGVHQCKLETTSGAQLDVLLCGAASALDNAPVRDYAVQLCLANDAQQLQLRVPARGQVKGLR